MCAHSQVLADHGRSTHKLSEKWRIDCKKAKELGAPPPLPPYQQKKLDARKAKEEGKAKLDKVETDSSEEERAAADVAEAEAAEQAAGAAAETQTDDAMHNAEDKMCAAPPRTHAHAPARNDPKLAHLIAIMRARLHRAAIRAEDAQPNRPSFLAV